MRLFHTVGEAGFHSPKLSLSLATSEDEVREVQRLRFKVFIEAMGLDAPENQTGLDVDEFDVWCDHLIVRDTNTLKVVGTYRLMGPANTRNAKRFSSEARFDLSRLGHLRGRMVEAGRACIHPDYRSGGVIMLLWAGIAAYMGRQQCDYLIGCTSISLADGGHNAWAVCREVSQSHLAPAEYRVTPRTPFPIHHSRLHHPPRVPPLLQRYMQSGAWVCGDPAWDPDFHTADLFVLLPLARLKKEYARRSLGGRR